MGSQQSTCVSPKLTNISRHSRSSIRRKSNSIISGRSSTTEEIPAEQLLDVYLERRAHDNLAFAIEFQV